MVDGPEGATPLDPDEAEDLIPAHIHTREARLAYLLALRAADGENYQPLLDLYVPGRPRE